MAVSPPNSPPRVVLVVTGSQTIGVCDSVTISAAMSTGNAGRSFTYSWFMNAAQNSGLPSSRVNDLDIILRNFGSVSTVTLSADMFAEVGTFVISVSISNWLSSVDTNVFSFVRIDQAAPIVELSSPFWTTPPERPITLQAFASPPNLSCLNATAYFRFSYQWEQVSGGSSVNLGVTSLSALSLPAYALLPNQIYKFRVTVTGNSPLGTFSNSAMSEVSTVASSLIAVVSPGTSSQSLLQTHLVLSASSSFDPSLPETLRDLSRFRFAWTCVTGTGRDCMQGQTGSLVASTFAFATSAATVTDTYSFSVSVSDQEGSALARTSSASTTITFANGAVPAVTLRSFGSNVNPTDTLQLIASSQVDASGGLSVGVPTWTWTCPQLNLNDATLWLSPTNG